MPQSLMFPLEIGAKSDQCHAVSEKGNGFRTYHAAKIALYPISPINLSDEEFLLIPHHIQCFIYLITINYETQKGIYHHACNNEHD